MIAESSFAQLFRSTIDAFPNTRKRQHATDPIKISELRWVPYLGTRTLFLRALAENSEGGTYQPILTFKNVRYHTNTAPGVVEITASDGNRYLLSRLTEQNHILCRCNCADFHWRFNYFDHQDRSLYGRVRTPYVRRTTWSPDANPSESAGLCKHLLKMFYALEDSGLVTR